MPVAIGSSRTRTHLRGRFAITIVVAVSLLAAVPTAGAELAEGAAGPLPAAPVDPAATFAERAAAYAERVAAFDPDGVWAATTPGTGAVVADLDVPGAIPGELIVTTRTAADLDAMTRSGWQALDAVPYRRVGSLADRVALVSADPAAVDSVVAALVADDAVTAVEPNVRREYLAAPDDTSYGLQWAHQQTNAEQAWDTYTGQGGTAPLIAIIDSGVDATHPDLSGVVIASLRSANGSVFQGTAANDPCGIGHGTAVAGSAAAQGDNGFGVAGVLWQARVVDIALTSPENGCPGGPADSDTITAMSFTAGLQERPWAMNLSLGASLTGCSAGYQAAVDQARASGVAVVAAAGNDGSNQTSIPASCDGVISVAATNNFGGRATYSQTNPQIDIAAPGGDGPADGFCPLDFEDLVAEMFITTSLTDFVAALGPVCGDYSDPNGHRLQGISGTSFASPYVTGVVGLLRQLAADNGAPLSVDQVEAVIEGTATDAGIPGRDCEFGWGIVDIGAAVAAVGSGAVPAIQPDAGIGGGSCDGGGDACPVTPLTDEGGYVRIAATGATTAVCQAVAVSSGLPGGAAPYAVIAREDDPADALAGSAVGLGLGPLLFTPSTGALDPRTEAELLRVLDFGPGAPDVFIMGGTSAVSDAVDQRLLQLGMNPVRVAGAGREATGVAASQVVEQLLAVSQFTTRDYAFVAFGRNWPDAVAAGQMAAYYGIPILVTNSDALHPDTRAELQRLQPSQVFVLGGAAVISDAVQAEIAGLGLQTARLAGAGRVDTAVAVADTYIEELQADGAVPPLPVAINMDSNFNDILSASLVVGQGNVFLPLAGNGTTLTDAVLALFCGVGNPLFVIGGTDRISDATAQQAAAVAAGQGC